MGFIQIIQATTSKADELMAMDREYEEAVKGKSTVKRAIVARDRNDPKKHFIIVFFDSYEDAMKNSNLPETASFAAKQQALVDGPPTFHDLDILDDTTY